MLGTSSHFLNRGPRPRTTGGWKTSDNVDSLDLSEENKKLFEQYLKDKDEELIIIDPNISPQTSTEMMIQNQIELEEILGKDISNLYFKKFLTEDVSDDTP